MRARQAEEKTEEELPVPGQPPRDTVRAGGAAWLLLGGLLSATAEGEKKKTLCGCTAARRTAPPRDPSATATLEAVAHAQSGARC